VRPTAPASSGDLSATAAADGRPGTAPAPDRRGTAPIPPPLCTSRSLRSPCISPCASPTRLPPGSGIIWRSPGSGTVCRADPGPGTVSRCADPGSGTVCRAAADPGPDCTALSATVKPADGLGGVKPLRPPLYLGKPARDQQASAACEPDQTRDPLHPWGSWCRSSPPRRRPDPPHNLPPNVDSLRENIARHAVGAQNARPARIQRASGCQRVVGSVDLVWASF
jgi:hypothetical protein